MIKEISNIVKLVFKNKKHPDCIDCIDDIFIMFGEIINDDNVEYTVFIEQLYDIFIEYAPNIKPHYWQSIITVNVDTTPLDDLWDLFRTEREKHS